METKKSNGVSDRISVDLFDLNLPEVAEGEGPLDLPEPTYEAMREHALFLLRSLGSTVERSSPSPEPFVLD